MNYYTILSKYESITQVIHLSSIVQARLAKDKDVFDALTACFPAGTLSGAPKIKAMALIDKLEQAPRGLYGGVMCGIDANGNLDSAIIIRSAVINDNRATVQAGAGIVFDSIPQCEANETSAKAKAVLEAIQLAQGEAL